MARRKTRRRKSEDKHTYLALRVQGYEAQAEAALNLNAIYPQSAINLDDRDPLFRFITQLTITGTVTAPPARSGEVFSLSIYGDDAPSRAVNATLERVQARDERGHPRYRPYHGDMLPVYEPPPGLGLLHKVRGEKCWTGWVNALPRYVSDLLALLGTGRDLYLALHERKRGRERWLQSLSLQTVDPVDEME